MMPSSQKLALNCNFRWLKKINHTNPASFQGKGPGNEVDTTLQNLLQLTDLQLERFLWDSIKLSSFIFRMGITIKR